MKGQKGPSSVRPILELFRSRQHWGQLRETRWSAYGLSRAIECSLEPNSAEWELKMKNKWPCFPHNEAAVPWPTRVLKQLFTARCAIADRQATIFMVSWCRLHRTMGTFTGTFHYFCASNDNMVIWWAHSLNFLDVHAGLKLKEVKSTCYIWRGGGGGGIQYFLLRFFFLLCLYGIS